MNSYHCKIQLPIMLEHNVVIEDTTKSSYARFDPKQNINQEFVDWYESLDLYWVVGGYFYTPANWNWPPHIDGKTLIDWCKINWRTGGEGSSMKWYTPKENFELIAKTEIPRSVTDSTYSTISLDQVEVAYETVHAENCLINAGRIHSFDSGPTAQHITSVVLGRKKTGRVIMWEEIPEVFDKYIV